MLADTCSSTITDLLVDSEINIPWGGWVGGGGGGGGGGTQVQRGRIRSLSKFTNIPEALISGKKHPYSNKNADIFQ